MGDRVTLGADSEVGRNSSIGDGSYLARATVVGESVQIGPNVSCQEPADLEDSRNVIVIDDSALIDIGATICSSVRIGVNAEVGAGSVVTRDVPPNAIVVGNPAAIVGYRPAAPNTPSISIRATSLSDDRFPFSIGHAVVHRLQRIDDLRGSLTFAEMESGLPFRPKRFFTVFNVPSREARGEHAHRQLHELLVCIRGECAVVLDDGFTTGEIMLDRPDVAIHIPPMIWRTHYKYSQDAVLLALASERYEADDYIRDYSDFVREMTRG